MAELMTTTVSQHPLPLPPQTVLADILVPEGDAASKLPNNHKSRGMNENFQASLADYTSDFSGILHYNENFECGVEDACPQKSSDVVVETIENIGRVSSSICRFHVPSR
ncbi:hypothetical protein EV368DRAFT_79420 [Lentinula lateritia]|nr:hypothetical protein EV368DRAFT_79420 [Lentinula lateritia]